MIKQIQAGTLDIDFSYGQERLDDLLEFASRENQKRGFLFVSKVLGKHIPVAPAVMRAVYDELAELCHVDCGTYVIGMAETATGLGAGFADSLARKNPHYNVFYQHTTRHKLDHPIWLTLDEIHSHAVDHILYRPCECLHQDVMSAEKLILVDDEVTTGRTLLLLASGVIAKIPSIKEVIVVTLASWLKKENISNFDGLDVPVSFVQLLRGEFTFTPNSDFKVRLPGNVDDGLCYDESRDDLGRTGLKMPYQLEDDQTFSDVNLNEPTVVVGTGEHLYYPFLLAERLSKKADTVFQSTTRSPIMKGDAIKRKVRFDPGNGKVNFIYNLPQDRKMLMLCESTNAIEVNGLLRGEQEEVADE